MRGHHTWVSSSDEEEQEQKFRAGLDGKNLFWATGWLLFNMIFSGVLLFIAFSPLPARQHECSIESAYLPYSPIREDGAEQFITTRYKPSKVFQFPPSEEVDEAWDGWLRVYDNGVLIPSTQAKEAGLPESIEAWKDPGNKFYSFGVYHQMHCLNRIRKSFYPERYYPNESAHELEHHVHHCFDVLRQSILCHGDISLVYWWNRDWSYVDEAGTVQYTEEYLRMTEEEQAKHAFATWDTEVQCRDMEAINAWALAHRVDPDKYGGQRID